MHVAEVRYPRHSPEVGGFHREDAQEHGGHGICSPRCGWGRNAPPLRPRRARRHRHNATSSGNTSASPPSCSASRGALQPVATACDSVSDVHRGTRNSRVVARPTPADAPVMTTVSRSWREKSATLLLIPPSSARRAGSTQSSRRDPTRPVTTTSHHAARMPCARSGLSPLTGLHPPSKRRGKPCRHTAHLGQIACCSRVRFLPFSDYRQGCRVQSRSFEPGGKNAETAWIQCEG